MSITSKMKAKKKKKEISEEDKATAKRLQVLWAEHQHQNKQATQESVALDMKISQSAVGQYLRGELPFGLEITLKFANVLEVHVSKIKRFDVLEGGFNQIASQHENEVIRSVIELMEGTTETTRIEIRGIVRNYIATSTTETKQKVDGRTGTHS